MVMIPKMDELSPACNEGRYIRHENGFVYDKRGCQTDV
ncbi:Unknown protein sequence [Pseudomonas syringae pv. syringae]|nr:Unknown protein sequence [Pseudomonas syringae pv. aceris]KPB14840.1 Unknown protein sequence [Pseudomonas syringae pv. syringae]KPB30546.1 Unknown protein sequence [Pseudomonas syringae pv. syringae]